MYSPLYIKTEYSLLSSLIKIDNLIEKCKACNITSLAICDDNLFGTMEFIKKCNKNNIKPIIGLDIKYLSSNILLYAKNINGYHNLIKLEGIKEENDVTFDDLNKYNNDLICICFNEEIYMNLRNIYNDIYVGINSLNEKNNINYTKNIVFVNKTLYLERYEYKYLPYIFMIRDGKTINDGISFIYQNNHLFTYDEVINKVGIDEINNTLKIANMCNIEFENKLYMPKYDTSNSKEFLINLANKGLNKRLNGNVSSLYKERLNHELDVIIKMHFEDYFLVVYDYIKFAKQNNILVGPGRGSAAGSLVCYSLGITDVDPLKYNLLFERFLNPERITLPDIDTDFPDEDRDRVIDYVKEKYGKDHVSGIITFGTLKSKQAIRDVGRILNIKNSDIDYLCKRLSMNESLKDLRKRSMEISNFIDGDDKLKLLYNIVNEIENNKRHTSIHAAGIVISYKALDEIVPIYKQDDLNLTEYTMEYLEELGLIKMDFLGLKNLSIIKEVIDNVNKEKSLNINFNNIPLDDKFAIDIFKMGDTTGIFQFESEGMKKFLKDLKPENFNDISSAIALYRPGPASNIPLFIKRRQNLEKIDYINPALEDILKETYGIIVYQEQIMLIAKKLASYTLGEADILRRAMSKKKIELLKQEEERFINNSVKNGYTKEESKEVYDLILKFANYGFNKSHSICYSLIAYRMAYLKAYFPTYFYASLLKGVIGSEIKTIEYLNELKKINIKVLPPSINESNSKIYKVNDKEIMLPLTSIRNIGNLIANYIEEEKLNGKFIDIYNFLKRIYKKTNNIKVIESLIYAHCFDEFGINITTLINNLDDIMNYISLTIDLDDISIEKPILKFYDNDVDDILEHEKELFGFYVTSHKTEKYKLLYKNITNLDEVSNNFNKDINIIISIDRIKEINTKNNDIMAFVNGVDSTGNVNITVFPNKYDLIKEFKKNDILLINGKVEKRFNEYQIILNKVKKLN